MARYYYSSSGRLRGVSYSSKEKSQSTGTLLLLSILFAPFYPLYKISEFIYDVLSNKMGLHALFAGIIAVGLFALGVYALWRSLPFRYLYFGVTSVVLSVIVFMSIKQGSDAIWGTFFAAITLVAGLGATYVSGLVLRPDNTQQLDDQTPEANAAPIARISNNSTIDRSISREEEGLSYPLNDDEALHRKRGLDPTFRNC